MPRTGNKHQKLEEVREESPSRLQGSKAFRNVRQYTSVD
jgi:hypothetical protein